MDNIETINKESIFTIWKVQSVLWRSIKVSVNKDKNSSHIIYDWDIIKNVSVWSYIKILKWYIKIIWKVEWEETFEEKVYNKDYWKEEIKINRVLQVSLFWHFEWKKFKQGIKEMPLIDNECYLLDSAEFKELHSFHKEWEWVIEIWCLTEDSLQRIQLSINTLFASHIWIFWNTWSWKSNTLTKIYTELFKISAHYFNFQKNSRFIFIDFNWEYISNTVLTENKKIYNLSTNKEKDKINMPSSILEKLEILSVLLEATEKTQQPFLRRAINVNFLYNHISNNLLEWIQQAFYDLCLEVLKKAEVSLNVWFFLELLQNIRNLVDKDSIKSLDKMSDNITKNLTFFWNVSSKAYKYNWKYTNSGDLTEISDWLFWDLKKIIFDTSNTWLIQTKIIYKYFLEFSQWYFREDFVKPVIWRMFKKFSTLEKLIESSTKKLSENIIIVSLKEVNVEMKKIIPLLLCKQYYDEKKQDWNENTSLHIIIDEAHNILSEESNRESETWKDYRLETFEEIVKEWRKFWVFLTIASQRPSDISPTIISQLHNYFIHKLINNNDIEAVRKTVAYLDKLSFESIPILSQWSCFIAWTATDIPVKVNIDYLEDWMRPKSDTIKLEDAWK